jgi:hypothetical protein
VARTRRGLAVEVAGFLAEDLAMGVDRERLSRRLAGRYSGPVHPDDRAAVRKAWAIRTDELLDDYHTDHAFSQQATHGRHEDILAEVVRAERRAERLDSLRRPLYTLTTPEGGDAGVPATFKGERLGSPVVPPSSPSFLCCFPRTP